MNMSGDPYQRVEMDLSQGGGSERPSVHPLEFKAERILHSERRFYQKVERLGPRRVTSVVDDLKDPARR